jgi:hypothetical protein
MRPPGRRIDKMPDDVSVRPQYAYFIDKEIIRSAESRSERLAAEFMRSGAHAGEGVGEPVRLDFFAGLRGRETLAMGRGAFGHPLGGLFGMYGAKRRRERGGDRGAASREAGGRHLFSCENFLNRLLNAA